MDGKARGVQRKLTGGLRGIPAGGAEAGTVVGDVQIVVHGLGDTDDLYIQTLCLSKLGNLITGIHGVVAAVVEEAVNIELLQSFNDGGIIRVRQLPAAGADGGSGGMGELADGGSGNVGQVNEIALQNALRAEPGGIDLVHLTAFPGCFHNPLQAGVDHRGGAAAVGYQNIYSHVRHLVFYQIPVSRQRPAIS